jgi:hypothetical protein
MKISQSLVKEILKFDHCPKQIYYSFVENKELIEPSENMLLGRYFESELLGACRGGEKQEARLLKNGDKAKPFADCDDLVNFAKGVLKRLNIDISKGKSQLYVETDFLSGNIDHRNKDILSEGLANYDVKWTATKEDDRWNGWGDPESKEDAKIQAIHYTLLSFQETGEWLPFYFIVFGRDKWVKVIQYKITNESMAAYKAKLANTGATIKEYAEKNYKGNGSFNKCISCPFYEICPDKSSIIEIETYQI